MSPWREIGKTLGHEFNGMEFGPGTLYVAEPCGHQSNEIALKLDRNVFHCTGCEREVPACDVEAWDRPPGVTSFQVASMMLNEGYAA